MSDGLRKNKFMGISKTTIYVFSCFLLLFPVYIYLLVFRFLCSSPLSFLCLLRFRYTFTWFLTFPSSISPRFLFWHFHPSSFSSSPRLFFSFTYVTITLLGFCFMLLQFSLLVPLHGLLFFFFNNSYPLCLLVLLYYVILIGLLLSLLAPLFFSSVSLLLAFQPRDPPPHAHTQTL